MCIVSILRDQDQFILTHNRDEDIARITSKTLITDYFHEKEATFPRDELSGGTWILTSDLWSTAILNGAIHKHKRNPPYRHSRGKFPFMLLAFEDLDEYVQSLNLNQIEAFTQIIFNHSTRDLHILYWDEKEIILKNPKEDLVVLSSTPLYSKQEKQEHKDAISALKNPNADDLARLHKKLSWQHNPEIPMLKTTSQVQIISDYKNKRMKFEKYSK